jgi:hypothetical protein
MAANHESGGTTVQMGASLLLTLIDLAERGLSLRIALSVGGATIEGMIVSEEGYFERLSELVEAKSPDQAEQAEHLREFLRGVPSTHDESAMRQLDEGADPKEAVWMREALSLSFIHRSDTRIMQLLTGLRERRRALEGEALRRRRLLAGGYRLRLRIATP